ncbi:MAG: hypothetical protein CGW95_05530 [Phenylobacterium zucineum]|nr:MAG: hypothetical protein CGW95_05530 [Phenylobacterium zucineum]
MSSPSALTADLAAKLANIALGHVNREYPHKLDHMMTGPQDVRGPRDLHPIFYGSFDWHSCVHSHWLLAVLLRLYPDMPQASAIRTLFHKAFTPEKVEVERAYISADSARGFSRPYGWAWLLKLQAELTDHNAPWARTFEPLARAFADRFKAFLPHCDYPIRTGVHSCTAFALTLSADYARRVEDQGLFDLLKTKAQTWYGGDRACQAWEPSGDDFLSPALMEAECMRRLLGDDEFRVWFDGFLPDAAAGEPQTLFHPARVSDRTDGKIAHLDGLNLSRAWCWRSIASGLSGEHPVQRLARSAAERHLAVGLPHLTGDYMGEHWLASFALLALTPN